MKLNPSRNGAVILLSYCAGKVFNSHWQCLIHLFNLFEKGHELVSHPNKTRDRHSTRLKHLP